MSAHLSFVLINVNKGLKHPGKSNLYTQVVSTRKRKLPSERYGVCVCVVCGMFIKVLQWAVSEYIRPFGGMCASISVCGSVGMPA